MKTRILQIILPALLIAFYGCKPSYYIANDFNSKTRSHKRVAVIPVEMEFTGQKPKKLTDAQIDSLELVESKMFQESLFNNLLKYSTTNKGTVKVEFVDYSRTNKMLEDSGIKIRDAWAEDPSKLARLLNVDAVVKTKIVKQRNMSDLASLGIQTAGKFINAALGGGAGPMMQATKNGRTNDIDAQCTLLNGADGVILWKDMHKAGADWNTPANEVIDRITVYFARNFPYR